MVLQVLTFNSEINFSLQVGDTIYYSQELGVVTSLYPQGLPAIIDPSDGITVLAPTIPINSIIVSKENITSIPTANDYIMFAKNKEVNSSSLKGYYAEVEFKNHSTDEIKLFSISSEVSESSK